MIDRICDLFRRQTDVHRLQDSPHHWNGKVGLQESVAVPVEHADGVAGADTKPVEAGREPPDALAQLPVSEAPHVAIYDLLIGRLHERRMPQLLYEQWILICGLGDLYGPSGHGGVLKICRASALDGEHAGQVALMTASLLWSGFDAPRL